MSTSTCDELDAALLAYPRCVGLVGWLVLAFAVGVHAAGVDLEFADERSLHRGGAATGEIEIGRCLTIRVGVTHDLHFEIGVLGEHAGDLLESPVRLSPDAIAVHIEEIRGDPLSQG